MLRSTTKNETVHAHTVQKQIVVFHLKKEIKLMFNGIIFVMHHVQNKSSKELITWIL